MHKPIYREALKHAWFLVSRNTSLWLLGLLSVLYAGSFGLSNFLSQIMATMGSGGQAARLLAFTMPALGVSKISAIIWLTWVVGILIVLLIAVIYISITAKSALLIAMADYYKRKTVPKLRKIWNEGLKYFWSIFTIETLRKIALITIIVAFGCVWIALPFYANTANIIINIVSLIIAIILGWVVSALSVFCAGYVIIDNKSLITAVKKAWTLFHNHLLVSFEISAILTIIDLLLIIFFMVIASFSFLPSLFIWILAGAFSSAAVALLGAVVGFIVLILMIAIFGAIYNTFYTSVWMYLFMKMHHEGILSRMFHHLGKFFTHK